MSTTSDIRLLSLVFLATAGCLGAGDKSDGDDGDQPWSGDGDHGEFHTDIEVNGIDRTLYLFASFGAVEAMPDGPVPLLFALHGANGNGEEFVRGTRLKDLADRNDFLVVGPDSIGGGWFLQPENGWTSPDGNSSSFNNDLELMIAIIDLLDEDYHIDHDRIFTTGFSRGAGMSAALATSSGQIEMSTDTYVSPFAAHSVVAGFDIYGGTGHFEVVEPKNPVWVIHGTQDTGVPYSMGADLADDLEAADWDVTFTSIEGAPHSWLYEANFGQDNQNLWDWCMASADS